MPYRRERGAVRPTRAQLRPSARHRESVMRKHLAAVLPVIITGALIAGCEGETTATSPTSQPEQTQSEATATQDAPSTDTTSSTETPAQPAQPEESADLASVREEIASDGTMGAVWYLGMYVRRLLVVALHPHLPGRNSPAHQVPLHGGRHGKGRHRGKRHLLHRAGPRRRLGERVPVALLHD